MALTELTKITGPGIKTDTNWVGNNANYSGIVTATSFVGSGASLTGIDATAVKDSSGNVKIQAEAYLFYVVVHISRFFGYCFFCWNTLI